MLARKYITLGILIKIPAIAVQCTPRMILEKLIYDENVVKAHFPLPQDLTFLPSKMAQFLKPSDQMSHFRR